MKIQSITHNQARRFVKEKIAIVNNYELKNGNNSEKHKRGGNSILNIPNLKI
jgi:hypothetical protein